MENTHLKYKTESHEHLNALVTWALGEYPNSGLLLIGCEDGRFFIELEHGEDYNDIDEISKPFVVPYIEPKFFNIESEALDFAIMIIKKIHPSLKDFDLKKYYDLD